MWGGERIGMVELGHLSLDYKDIIQCEGEERIGEGAVGTLVPASCIKADNVLFTKSMHNGTLQH